MISKKNFNEIRGFFMRKDINLSDRLFNEAMKSLIEKGLIECKIEVDGDVKYRLTNIGEQVSCHYGTDPKIIN